MKSRNIAGAACALAILGGAFGPPGAAQAQNANLSPTFGSITLRTGFDPDPHIVEIVAGGSIDAYRETDLPAACVGKISEAPDYSVTYTAGRLPLAIRAVSNSDTTLIVNGPDGRWTCDDDSFGDGDPQVVFRNPRSGRYDIWLGTYGNDTARARLGITETP
jgi:hypothetical protein